MSFNDEAKQLNREYRKTEVYQFMEKYNDTVFGGILHFLAKLFNKIKG